MECYDLSERITVSRVLASRVVIDSGAVKSLFTTFILLSIGTENPSQEIDIMPVYHSRRNLFTENKVIEIVSLLPGSHISTVIKTEYIKQSNINRIKNSVKLSNQKMSLGKVVSCFKIYN